MKQWKWLILVALIVILDQVSKRVALYFLFPYHPVPVMPMFNLTLAFNTGAAFSFLHATGRWHEWFFLLFGAGMSIFFAYWLLTLNASFVRLSIGLSCILAGALGNLCDRLMLGHVVDFIELYAGHYYWPVFNVADISICIGAGLLALEWFSSEKSSLG